MTGLHFWAARDCASTVGLDEEQTRKNLREQEKRDSDQGKLGFESKWYVTPSGLSGAFPTGSPPAGATSCAGPLGRAFLIPRPLSVVG